MKTYTVIHTHRFGADVMFVTCPRIPTEEEIVEALDLNFEKDRDDEQLEWEEMRKPTLIP